MLKMLRRCAQIHPVRHCAFDCQKRVLDARNTVQPCVQAASGMDKHLVLRKHDLAQKTAAEGSGQCQCGSDIHVTYIGIWTGASEARE